MPTLVLLRHGQSQWNLENRFTGWWDVDLYRPGHRRSARRRAAAARNAASTSIAASPASSPAPSARSTSSLHEMDRLWLPVTKDWRLNERHYGGLTGLNKQEMIDKVGAEQVKIWRRSYDIPPPPLARRQPVGRQPRPPLRRHRRAAHRKPQGHDRPRACLITMREIAPALRAGKRVLVSAHGNSLRGDRSNICRTSATRRSSGSKSRPASRSSTSCATTCRSSGAII